MSEAFRNLHSIADEVTITSLPTDRVEEDLVSKFMSMGCGCVKRCSKQFSLEYIRSVRRECAELEHAELDMAILGPRSVDGIHKHKFHSLHGSQARRI